MPYESSENCLDALNTPAFKTNSRLSLIYPWIIIILCSFFLLYKYILQISPSVMTHDLMRTFHISGTGLGNLAASYFYSYVIVQLLAGVLIDQYSPRFLTILALTFCSLGAWLFSQSHSLLLAELSRVLIGIGAAFATVSYMKFVTIWFPPRQFALVSGLVATSAMIGALLAEMPLAYLVDRLGWQRSLHICAVLGIVIAILFLIIVRDKPVGTYKWQDQSTTLHDSVQNVLKVLRSKRNWILAVYSGLAFAPLAVFGGLWGNPFLEEAYTLSKTEAANFISLIFIGLAIGAPLTGFISEKWKHHRLLIMKWGLLLTFSSITLIIYYPYLPHWLLGGLLFLFGMGTGGFMLGFTLAKENHSAILAATVVALINTGDALFGAISEPSVGKLLDWTWDERWVHGVPYFSVSNYQWALGLLPLYVIIAFFCIRLLKKTNISLEKNR